MQPMKPRFNIMWLYGLLMVFLIWWAVSGEGAKSIEVGWNELRPMIERGDVEKVLVENEKVAHIFLKENVIKKYIENNTEYSRLPQKGAQFTYMIPSVEVFENSQLQPIREVHGQDIADVRYVETSNWGAWLPNLIFLAVMLGLWIFIFRSMSRNAGGGGGNGGIFNVGKAKAQMFDKTNQVKTTFKDVAGLEEAKVEIMEIVDFLKKPQKYKDLGGKIPKGALLVGPPGTGKTLLAKAVAGEANVPFFSMSGSDFVEMFVGVGASRVRDLFKQAKEKAPCIVFIDEIDAIGRARGKNVGYSSNDERENTLNQLLTEMDGFGTNSGVIILAATNRADILDKALMRAGRFDRQIEVGLPELNERREIFDVHLKGLKLAPGLDRDFLAKQTPGFSGADIANVCNEAALIAARRNKPSVDKQDFLDAIDRIVGGLERRSVIITPEEKRKTAFHEAGHATVSWKLKHANPVIKVTIIPRGRSLGATWYLPDDRHNWSREQFMDEMAALLAGKVAEQYFFGDTSTGALNDLERVTKMATAMVTYYGMSERIGNVSYYDSTGQSDMGFTKPFSEKTAQDIDAEVRRLIDEAEVMSRRIIDENREGIERLAQILLDREVIFSEDVEAIFGKSLREERQAVAATITAEVETTDDGRVEMAEQVVIDTTAESAEETAEKTAEEATEEATEENPKAE
ncbi:ATP-dependent zinc metalloprotease FtsH [Alistipes sp. OttesenSCG-928-B03]|nr:ATP-dependent zinc metalloprotease FtsH [Alistipes sp. OttesenSCG-928-B03]